MSDALSVTLCVKGVNSVKGVNGVLKVKIMRFGYQKMIDIEVPYILV